MYRITKESRNSNVDEGADYIMADTLIAGTTLVEKESRSIGDIPIGGIVEWNDTFGNLPDGFVLADGSTVNDPLSAWNGTAVPNYNIEYLSLGGYDFKAPSPDVDDIIYSGGKMTLTGAGLTFLAPIQLPHGSTITAAIVYSNVSTENWTLNSNDIEDTGGLVIHAGAALNTEDTTITTGTINNLTTRYYFGASASMDATDVIYGARITYTPREKFIIRIR